jgi:hypothetical protein
MEIGDGQKRTLQNLAIHLPLMGIELALEK